MSREHIYGIILLLATLTWFPYMVMGMIIISGDKLDEYFGNKLFLTMSKIPFGFWIYLIIILPIISIIKITKKVYESICNN